MSTIYLRVKIKSLAAESVMIRREESIQRRIQNWAKPRKRIEVEPGKWQRPPVRNEAAYDKARSRRLSLCDHRKVDVREESRAAQLAYGFFRGTPYYVIETLCYNPPNWKRVEQLVVKYNETLSKIELLEQFEKWKTAARTEVSQAA